MHRLLLAAFLSMLLAGCAGGSPSDEGAGDGTPDTPSGATPPADIVFEGNLNGAGYQQVAPVDPLPACALEDRQCATHAVTVPEGTWNVTFTLVGTGGPATSNIPAGAPVSVKTDYDLFVDGVGESTEATGIPDVVKAKLDAGTYNAQVLAWNDVDGSYTLTIHFDAP